jgi:hypothetical protein
VVGSQEFLVDGLGDVTALASALLDEHPLPRAPMLPCEAIAPWPLPPTPSEYQP